MSFVEIDNLVFRYKRNDKPIIDGFSLSLDQGEIVGMIGASGSGKSTILRLIAGLDEPEQGGINIGGVRMVEGERSIPAEKRGVGMVFQDYALFPHLTVAANIMFGLHKRKRTARSQRLQEMLELVQLQDYAKRYPHELSGGQQQRTALARALAPQPSLLLMDEPFSNLDADLKGTIRQELKYILQQANMTCVLVSHDRDDIEAICDRSIRIGEEPRIAVRKSS